MPHDVKILLDSTNCWGHRLTSFEIVFPRIILSEWNTHCMFNRNSASSRAIPVEKVIERVMTDPYIPTTWGKNQKGMSSLIAMVGEEAVGCESDWLHARDTAVYGAQQLMKRGLHKQWTNRLLEPFMWHTIINTATEYSNFLGLRDSPTAHPDIQIIARMMREAFQVSSPRHLNDGEWHTPYAQQNEDLRSPLGRKITTGRCARVSYLTHAGDRDPEEDVRLHDNLLANGHLSPFAHPARPMTKHEYWELFCQEKLVWNEPTQEWIHEMEGESHVYTHFCEKYQGWIPYRKMIPHEEDYGNYLKNRLPQA